MKYFLGKIALRYIKYSLVIWLFLILVDLLLEKVFGDKAYLFSSMFGFFGANFFSTILMNSTRWPLFWRRASGSIFKFWSGICGILFSILSFNFVVHLLVLEIVLVKGDISKLFAITIFDQIWAIFLIYLFCISSIFDAKAHLANTALKPAKQFTIVLVIYAYMIILFAAMAYSRVIAYPLGSILLLGHIFLQNSFVLLSIQKKTRLKYFSLGVVATIAFSIVSYEMEMSRSLGTSSFLGKLGQEKKWNYTDIEKVNKASSWVNWWNAGILAKYKYSNEDKLNALEKLESLCPPIPNDHPSVVLCFENDISDSQLEAVVYGEPDEKIVLSQIASSRHYIKLLGLLSARQIKDLSSELKTKLKEISDTPGRLGPIAEKTLVQERTERMGMRVVVRQKEK